MSKCIECGRTYQYDPNKGHGKDVCNSCRTREYRRQKKVQLLDYMGGACELCGYDRCPRALEFHHLDPSSKKFNVSGNASRRWEVLVEEADKCVLLCANCHREVEDGYITLDL